MVFVKVVSNGDGKPIQIIELINTEEYDFDEQNMDDGENISKKNDSSIEIIELLDTVECDLDEPSADDEGKIPKTNDSSIQMIQLIETVETDPDEQNIDKKKIPEKSRRRKPEPRRKKRIQCDECHIRFESRYKLELHRRSHTGEKPFPCSVCGKHFARMGNLREHQRVHTGEKPFKCDLCNKRFAKHSILYRHKMTHTGERPHACDECSSAYTTKTRLIDHQRVHTGEKPFSCDLCPGSFTCQRYLNKHVRNKHGENTITEQVTCYVCKTTFGKQSDLEEHYSECAGEDDHTCKMCSEKFSGAALLAKHLETHEGGKLYVTLSQKLHRCQVCERTFVSEKSLLAHTLCNSNEKKNPCDEPKQCEVRQNWIEEVNEESDANEILRDIEVEVEEDEKTVTVNTKSFVCQKCGEEFSKRASLLAHGLYIHNDNGYQRMFRLT